jgi:RNA polymerase sigma factor (sigma-70 family)
MVTADSNDAVLVAASLGGNRDAFGVIVSRYQSLVCSLAYSATGSLTQSEDLAQETFLTAWKQLKQLQEPQKLRSWLCGIARNLVNNYLRRQGREPIRHAEPLDAAAELPGGEAPTPHRVIQREEEAILWRSLERIPDVYREPLVLFYREGQSVERVATQLELSEDAVKQRLSRGRKLLADEVSAFIEGALKQSNPGRAFTIGVLAALPAFTTSATAAAIGTSAAKGTTAAKSAGLLGMISGAVLGPILAFLGTWIGYRMSLSAAGDDRERQYVKQFYHRLIACIGGFAVVFLLIMAFSKPLLKISPRLFAGLLIGLGIVYLGVVLWLWAWSARARRNITEAKIGRAIDDKPAFEYRSRTELLGLPLVHVRIGGSVKTQKVAKAWFAMGDCAVGGLFAFGGLAIAPVSLGGCAFGLLGFGGVGVGILGLGGFVIGIWSLGGCAFGWQAFAGCAIAWEAAVGGTAVAHDFALGGIAIAAQANNDLATAFVKDQWFFQKGLLLLRNMFWLHLLWVGPMIWWWRCVARKKRAQQNGSTSHAV